MHKLMNRLAENNSMSNDLSYGDIRYMVFLDAYIKASNRPWVIHKINRMHKTSGVIWFFLDKSFLCAMYHATYCYSFCELQAIR